MLDKHTQGEDCVCVWQAECSHACVGAYYYLDNAPLKNQWNISSTTLDVLLVESTKASHQQHAHEHSDRHLLFMGAGQENDNSVCLVLFFFFFTSDER